MVSSTKSHWVLRQHLIWRCCHGGQSILVLPASNPDGNPSSCVELLLYSFQRRYHSIFQWSNELRTASVMIHELDPQSIPCFARHQRSALRLKSYPHAPSFDMAPKQKEISFLTPSSLLPHSFHTLTWHVITERPCADLTEHHPRRRKGPHLRS